MNTPKEIAQNYIAIGKAKVQLPVVKMLLLGILAGMFIALAGVGMIISQATVQTASLAKLTGACVFPVGLVMVLIAGSELFTGNCLLIIPVLEKEIKLRAMLKNWVFVYIGNLAGSLLVAALSVYGGTYSLFGGAAAVSLINTAAVKVSLTFTDALFRGILCNFLVCIAVWIAFSAKSTAGKIAGLYMPVMLFVLCGYEHSVANMLFIPAGIMASQYSVYAAAAAEAGSSGALTWGAFFINNLLPVTLGNIIGGCLLVGTAYWAVYLRAGSDKEAAAEK